MVVGSSNAGFVATLRLSGGTLAAKATWSTEIPVATSATFEVKTADASNVPQNINLSGPVTGTGSLIKSGAGTLTVSGTYSYSGGTTVTEGTLTLDSGSLSDTGIVDVTSGAVLNLNFAGTDTVDEFSIDGSPQGEGTFGAIGSGADTETALITGTGILLVLPNDPFVPWADGFGLAGLDAEKTADPDKDGLSNFQEFAFDSDPTTGAASGKIRSRIETVGADQALVITLPVRNGAVFAGTPAKASTIDEVLYTIEGSNNLAAFDQGVSEIAVSAAGMPSLSTGWSYRSFRLNGAIPARGATGFLRADVADATP